MKVKISNDSSQNLDSCGLKKKEQNWNSQADAMNLYPVNRRKTNPLRLAVPTGKGYQ